MGKIGLCVVVHKWQAAGFSIGCSIISLFGRIEALNNSSIGLYWLRRFYSFLCKNLTGPRERVYKVEDICIPGPETKLKLRIYRPSQESRLPAMIYLHGGCFCVGDLNSHDASLRALANASSCLVIAVDYRLSPEHRFPAAIEDALCVLNWAADNARELGLDRDRIAIAGDSAGGAIAATAVRWARDRRGPKPAAQVLIYPMTAPAMQTKSAHEFARGPVISRALLTRSWSHYSPKELRVSDEFYPLSSHDLRNLPHSIIVTAAKDPLRDEGEDYAEALRSSGVSVSAKRYPDTVHGFFQLPGTGQGKQVISDIARSLNEHFQLCAALRSRPSAY